MIMILQLQYIGDAEKREERKNKRQQVYRNGIILFFFPLQVILYVKQVVLIIEMFTSNFLR